MIKKYLQSTKNGNCIDAYSYLREHLITTFKVIKAEALDKEHGYLWIGHCTKIIANDLKTNMTQEQINKLQPIDLFCWWNKHYNLLPQDSNDISFNIIRHKGTLYDYVQKNKDKVIAHIGVSLTESKIESIPLCSD